MGRSRSWLVVAGIGAVVIGCESDPTAVPPESGNVILDFARCIPSDRPTWLAYQNGTEAWKVATPSGGQYTFNVTAGKAGVAWVTDPGAILSYVLVHYRSQAELIDQGPDQFCAPPPSLKNLTISTANLPVDQSASISLGGGSGSASFQSPIARVSGVTDGTHDLVASTRSVSGATGVDRIFIRRDVNTTPIPSGGLLGFAVDFADSTSAFAPATARVSIGGLASGEQVAHGMAYLVESSCQRASLDFFDLSPIASFLASGVPLGKQRSSDLHSLVVIANSGDASAYRQITEIFPTLTDRTVTLPAPIPVFTPSTVAGAYKTLRFQLSLPSHANKVVIAGYSAPATTPSKVVNIAATSGWLSGTTVDLTMPIFTGLPGWHDTWVPASDATVMWSLLAAGSTTGNSCSAGVSTVVSRNGSL